MSNLFNYANPSNWQIAIPDGQLTKGFTLNAQGVTLPAITIPPTKQVAGQYGLAVADYPSSHVEFDPLVVRFIVDEHLESYLNLYTWMLSIVDYNNGNSTAWKDSIPEAVQVHMMDNERRNIVCTFNFYGCWCSQLGELELTYTDDMHESLVCTAILPFKTMSIERDGQLIVPRPAIQAADRQRVEGIKAMHPAFRK